MQNPGFNRFHLDMAWRHRTTPKSKPVKCLINCDAHRLEQAAYLRLGAGIARKASLTKTDILNTLPLNALKKELAKKKSRASKA